MDLTALAIRLIVCPRCLRGPGYRCISATGLRARYCHTGRTAPIYDAWRIGYSDGLVDALGRVRRHIERGRDVDAIEAELEQAVRR